MDRTHDLGETEDPPVRAISSTSTFTFSCVVPPHVRSVLIDDRAVVHDTLGGHIIALDEAGTAIWRILHSDIPDGWSLDALLEHESRKFMDQLVSVGLLAVEPENSRLDRCISSKT